MAGWGWGSLKNQQMPNLKGLEFDENDLMVVSQKHGIDLIQNCDLPPPMKVFSGSDNKTVISSMKKRKTENFNLKEDDGDGKLGLLRALRLSQTRAREAEAKRAAMAKERESLVLAFMEDSMQLFAYRQMVRLLEFQVSKLQQQKKKKQRDKGEDDDDDDDDDGSGSNYLTWIMALAFCFGVAGFGFALGCKYYYS